MLTPVQEQAVTQIAAAAVSCENVTGCPAELTTAQCIIESGYLSVSPGNNCFGIKADGNGSGTGYSLTSEYLNGKWEKIQQQFETYNSLADCFSDHARLIQSGVYARAWEQYQQDHNLDDYIRGVAAYYATDPDYYTKIDGEAHSHTVTMALATARGNSIT